MLDRTAIEELSTSLQIEKVLSPRDNRYIRVSGLPRCRREIAYRLQWHKEGKEELPIWSHGLFTFDLGHGIHYRLQQKLSNVGALKWCDAEPYVNEHGQLSWKGNIEIGLVNHEYRIAGHCDGLTHPLRRRTVEFEGEPLEIFEVTDEDDPEGVRYIIDIKSITARERCELREAEDGHIQSHTIKPSSFEKLTRPKDEHIGQTSIYAWMTTQPGFETDRIEKPLARVPDIMIIYVAKDLDPGYYGNRLGEYEAAKGLLNAPYKVFTEKVSTRTVNFLLNKAKSIWANLEEGSLPPRDFQHKPERPAWACVDCPFRKECYLTEGFFAEDQITTPARLRYHVSRVNPDLIVLD